MKNKINYFLTYLILFFIFSVSVYARDYSIEKAELDYVIYGDGRISVTEKWFYDLRGCFNELYIQKPPYFTFEGRTYDFEMMNSSGYCVGAECDFKTASHTNSVSGDNELILQLKTNKCDSKVTAVYSYEIKQIILGGDVAQFYYKLWGESVEKPAPLAVSIHLPGPVSETQYFIHPWDLKTINSSSKNILTIESNQPAKKFLEINLLMPKNWFKENNENYYFSERTREQIISSENKDKRNHELVKAIIEPLIILLSFLIFFTPIILFLTAYFIYGTEYRAEDLGYVGQAYEREPPTKLLPEESAYFIDGKYSDRSFVAGIMYLIYKKYLDIEERGRDIYITLKKDADSELKEHQKKLLDIIKYKARGKNELNFREFSKKEYDNTLARKYEDWKKSLSKETNINKYLERKGTVFYAIASILTLAAAFILTSILGGLFETDLIGVMIFSVFTAFSTTTILIILSTSKPTLLGRWSKEGRILNIRWRNFRRYLSDFSYLKEHPPESVKIWDYFMAYAIAFGVAEKTLKAMKTNITEEEMKSSNIRSPILLTYPSFYNYHPQNHISSAAQSSRHSGGGGFGGSGGGGGGGGGGAR